MAVISFPLQGEVTISDTYSLAPLVQNTDGAFFSSGSGVPTVTFDEISESGGANLYGNDGGGFVVTEEIVSISNGLDRVIVKVTAVNSGGNAELWVDVSKTGWHFTSWRLDVGSNLGGTNPIQPGVSFTLVDSGFNVYNKAGALLGSFPLHENTSDTVSLSGVAVLGNNGKNIADVDVSSIHMYWEISYDPTDQIFSDGFE